MNRRQLLLGFTALMAGCAPPRARGVTVGGKNFTEQLILGEMLTQLLAAHLPVPVDSRLYLAGTYICQQALLAGRIDTYVEYTGTALSAVLKESFHRGADHGSVYETVKREYNRRFGLEVLAPLGFNNSFAMVVRSEDAHALGLKTLSDLGTYAPQWRMGIGYEFLERPDGYQGLVATYNLHFKEAPRVMDLGLLYRALQNRQVDIVAGSNTDGLIRALGLVVLEDDRGYFPPYDAVPIVRQDSLKRYPELGNGIDRLAGQVSADQMRGLNYAVDGERRDARVVVRDFLLEKKLLASRQERFLFE